MHSRGMTAAVTRRLTRHASTVALGMLFLFLSVLAYLSLCALPCENAKLKSHMEEHDDGTPYEDVEKFSAAKQYHSFITIIVLSAPKSHGLRDVLRQTWLSEITKDTLVRFVVGTKGLDKSSITMLEYENEENNDMVLLKDFKDSYEDLTHKLIAAFSWVDENIATKYVLKVDDDTFARMDKIHNELQDKPRARLYWGFFNGAANVKRSGQWAEPAWHLCDRYLPYARGGGYVLSADLVHYIVKNSLFLQKFKAEDVSVGAWLGPLNVQRIHDVRFDTEYRSRGCHNDYIVTHKQSSTDMRDKWSHMKETGLLCKYVHRMHNSYNYNWNVPSSQCCQRVPDIP